MILKFTNTQNSRFPRNFNVNLYYDVTHSNITLNLVDTYYLRSTFTHQVSRMFFVKDLTFHEVVNALKFSSLTVKFY